MSDEQLPCTLTVGVTRFNAGVNVSTAQGAIDRLYSRMRQVENILADANSLMRSMESVCGRKGIQTNWDAFHRQIREALADQHRFMHPEIDLEKLKQAADKASASVREDGAGLRGA